MPNWGKILQEIEKERVECLNQVKEYERKSKQAINTVRSRYLEQLHQATGRNIICYYSGWLSKRNANPESLSINDEDMNGFMMAVHELDRSKGLDLFLHTPGGGLYATQGIVSYLHSMFDGNIRAIVPEIAMSAGTMISCCCKEILMGKHSNLGPIDPQINGEPAESVRKCFENAIKDIKRDSEARFAWDSILRKYPLTFLSQCENSVKKSKTFVQEMLLSVMFKNDKDKKAKVDEIIKVLSKSDVHSEHLMFDKCHKIGLNVSPIETAKGVDGKELQDLILTVHHCYMHLMMNTTAAKIIENHNGIALANHVSN